MMMVAPPDWMSTKDAAAHLGVNLRTLYRFIDSGDLPAYKFVGSSRVDLQACKLEYSIVSPK